MRISLNKNEALTLIRILSAQKEEECEECSSVLNKIVLQMEKPTHPNKVKAAEKARRSRAKMTKAKVENAINLLRLYGDTFGYDDIAKEAEVSLVSAKKYGVLYLEDNKKETKGE